MNVQREIQVVRDAVPVRLLEQACLVVVHVAHAQDPPLVEGPLGNLCAELCIPCALQSAASPLRDLVCAALISKSKLSQYHRLSRPDGAEQGPQ